MKSWLIFLSIGAMILSGAEQRAHANVVYSYTGETYSFANGPYTTSMSVSGNFELAAPLAADLMSQMIAPVSYTFFDGINELINTNSLISEFRVSTDSQSNIVFWNILLEMTPIQFAEKDDTSIQITTNRISGGAPVVTNDVGSIRTCLADNGAGCTSSTNTRGQITSEDSGQWIGPPVPIPAALPLFATALAGLALVARRRNYPV